MACVYSAVLEKSLISRIFVQHGGCRAALSGRWRELTVFLGFWTAVEYWLTKPGYECVPESSSVTTLALASAAKRDVREARLPVGWSETKPLHVLVGDRADARAWSGVACHVWSGKIPAGSFNELYDVHYISSPEFTFLQMAAVLDFRDAVLLGDYLCGGFAIGENGRDYVGSREPLTDPATLAAYLDRAKGCYGIDKARRALKYIVPRCASPMEVFLAVEFSLPSKEGGWGMPRIEANERIDLDSRLWSLAGADHYFGDLYFPTVKGDVEYDSYEFHTGPHRLDHTAERRNILEATGVRTVSATWGQIDSFDKFSAFVWAAKKRFGIRQKTYSDEVRCAQLELYEHLMNRTRRMF